MPGLIKKVVTREFTELVEGQDGLTFGQHIDNKIMEALDHQEDVQEFTLHFEEAEWMALCSKERQKRSVMPQGFKPKPPKHTAS